MLDVARQRLVRVSDDTLATPRLCKCGVERRQIGSSALETDERVGERAPTLVLLVKSGRQVHARRSDVGFGRELARDGDDAGHPQRDGNRFRLVVEGVFDELQRDRPADVRMHRIGDRDRDRGFIRAVGARQSPGDDLRPVEAAIHPRVRRRDATRSTVEAVEEIGREIVDDQRLHRPKLIERDAREARADLERLGPDAEKELIEGMPSLQEAFIGGIRPARAGRRRECDAGEHPQQQRYGQPRAPAASLLGTQPQPDRPHGTNGIRTLRAGGECRLAFFRGWRHYRREADLERAGGGSTAPRRLAGCPWA